MSEQEQHQNYVEDQLLIKHGLDLLKEKCTHSKTRATDDTVKEYFTKTLPRIQNLISETEKNIIYGKHRQ
jgi:hypothetical protein